MRNAARAGVPMQHAVTGHSSRSTTILIVEDDPESLSEIEELLTTVGYTCIGTTEGAQALKTLDEQDGIEILITDIQMPGADGMDVLQHTVKLNDQGRDIRTIVLSNRLDCVKSALVGGADDFVPKPIHPPLLLKAIEKVRGPVSDAIGSLDLEDKSMGLLIEKITNMKDVIVDLKNANTHLEHLNAELTKAVDAKSKFLSLMSHHLRTPIHGILNGSNCLIDGTIKPGSPRGDELLVMLNKAGEDLARIVETILDFVDLSAATGSLASTSINVRDLMSNILSDAREQADSKDIKLKYRDVVSSPEVNADLAQLTRAINIIFKNALDHSGCSSIMIDVACSQEEFKCVIHDDGMGMSADEIESARHPFQQVAPDLTNTKEGLGLNIPLADLICRRHGGALQIESQRNQGTSVTIKIPKPIGNPSVWGGVECR